MSKKRYTEEEKRFFNRVDKVERLFQKAFLDLESDTEAVYLIVSLDDYGHNLQEDKQVLNYVTQEILKEEINKNYIVVSFVEETEILLQRQRTNPVYCSFDITKIRNTSNIGKKVNKSGNIREGKMLIVSISRIDKLEENFNDYDESFL